MSRDVQVRLGERSYPIRIGRGLLPRLGEACAAAGLGRSGLVVTDGHVGPLYARTCTDSLAAAGFVVQALELPPGESSKAWNFLLSLYGRALEAGLDRRSFVVALGGGVVGDLAGFMAATYLRGIAFVQAPTSLLAMVDSAVGGKTGINLPQGKNLVGAFHQPVLVQADLSTLATLPARELAAGLAEVVKYGVIRDAAFFARLEALAPELRAARPEALEEIVARCCELKAEVVGLDEREGGLRAILNFGHTLGHAVEKAAGYGGGFLHGEAVAVGMVYASQLSVQLAGLAPAEHERLRALLLALGLPVAAPGLAWPELRAAMAVDKKSEGRVPRFVLAGRIGSATPGREVPERALEEAWHVCGQ